MTDELGARRHTELSKSRSEVRFDGFLTDRKRLRDF